MLRHLHVQRNDSFGFIGFQPTIIVLRSQASWAPSAFSSVTALSDRAKATIGACASGYLEA